MGATHLLFDDAEAAAAAVLTLAPTPFRMTTLPLDKGLSGNLMSSL